MSCLPELSYISFFELIIHLSGKSHRIVLDQKSFSGNEVESVIPGKMVTEEVIKTSVDITAKVNVMNVS